MPRRLALLRSKLRFAYSLAAGVLWFAQSPLVPAQSAVRDRLTRPIDSGQVSTLRGNVRALARPEFDRGPVEGSFRLEHMTLMFKLSDPQQASLDALLRQLQDPSSPNYHHWLTPEQFGERFGLSSNDLAKITAWLQAQGFTVDKVARSRSWIAFSGTAAQAEAAFHTSIHRYTVNNETHYANAAEPSVPSALGGMVLGFRGLNDFRPRPRSVLKRVAGGLRPDFTSNVTGRHFLAPDDFATIYDVQSLYNAGIDGTGHSIAVMGQTDIELSDITAFRATAALPAINPTCPPAATTSGPICVLPIPGAVAGISTNDISEADLDIEWSGGIARNATIVYVNAGKGPTLGAFDSLQYAIDNNVAPVVSISYGDCEQDMGSAALDSLSALGRQANSQGITILAPGGDNGATDCDFSTPTTTVDIATHGLAVDAPASIPSFTGVGGTQFNDASGTYWSATNNANSGSALGYIPESVWNTTVADKQLAAGGGGKSAFFSKPFWQAGDGVPNDGSRDVPDISLAANPDNDGYLTCSQGSCVTGFRDANNNLTVAAGTSASVQAFAGVMALINQAMNSAQGNINPILYPLAASSPAAFHDIATGNNEEPCKVGTPDCPNGGQIGYAAGTGYDLASGLGSIDAFNLASAWATVSPPQGSGDFQLSVSPASVTVTGGGSGTATVTVRAITGFSGTVSLACMVASTLTSTSCSLSPTSIPTQGTATLKVTASTGAGSLAPGFGPPGGRWRISLGMLLGLLLLGILVRSIKPLDPASPVEVRRWLWQAMMIAGLIVASASCGGGSGNGNSNTTPMAQSGAVTVTATSGALSHTVQISVTVN